MTASFLRCPGCGAPANADAVRCDYCSSALATVTCPSCFAAMFVGSRFCSHCGGEASRERLGTAREVPCPRCRDIMQPLRLGAVVLSECGQCGGLWLDPETLRRLCNNREQYESVVGVLAVHTPSSRTAGDTVKYIPCPSCGKLMNRMNFARSSGVIMDVCKTDGVWLDRGELQRVLGFIERGGLAAQREREKEQLAEEQRRLVALQSMSTDRSNMVMENHGSFAFHSGQHSHHDTVGGLLFDLAGLFHG